MPQNVFDRIFMPYFYQIRNTPMADPVKSFKSLLPRTLGRETKTIQLEFHILASLATVSVFEI